MNSGKINLPRPVERGLMSLEECVKGRRSVRSFSPAALKTADLSQLLWSMQGVTSSSGYRAVPSAGALYPLKIFVFVGNVTGIASGVYLYEHSDHSMLKVAEGDRRDALYRCCLRQKAVLEAPVSFVISADYEKTTMRYGRRGVRYVFMEAGHVGQNVSLQAVALGLGTVMIGAFDDSALKNVSGIKEKSDPLYVIPVGKPE